MSNDSRETQEAENIRKAMNGEKHVFIEGSHSDPDWCRVCGEEKASDIHEAAQNLPAAPPEKGEVMDKPAAGLWRNNPETPEGKYLVKRRDGSVVEWPNFVIGAKDPCAPAALRAYAMAARELCMNEKYWKDVLRLADAFEQYRVVHGEGDPDRGRHRKDDPTTIEAMQKGGSA